METSGVGEDIRASGKFPRRCERAESIRRVARAASAAYLDSGGAAMNQKLLVGAFTACLGACPGSAHAVDVTPTSAAGAPTTRLGTQPLPPSGLPPEDGGALWDAGAGQDAMVDFDAQQDDDAGGFPSDQDAVGCSGSSCAPGPDSLVNRRPAVWLTLAAGAVAAMRLRRTGRGE